MSPNQRTRRPCEDILLEQFTRSVAPTTTCNPHQDQSQPQLDPYLHGKLVIMVEDFYYGSTLEKNSTNPSAAEERFSGPYRCIHCPKTLHNNIK